jgi:cytochrome c oxidase assembly protein subunit 15
LVLTCVLVWRCLRPQPVQPAARYAVLLLMLMLCLSALGFFSADPRLALVGFLNIVGGLGLVSFSWRVVMAAAPSSFRRVAEYAPHGPLLSAGLIVLTMTVLLGAWIGATYSAAACPTVPFCDGGGPAAVQGWAVLNPLVKLSSAPMPGDVAAATLHLLHRGLALLAVVVLGAAAVSSMRYRATRCSARAVLFLLVVVIALGISAVLSGLSLWLVVAHGAVAAMLLAAVAALLRR